MSSARIYPSVLKTVRAEPEAFRAAAKHWIASIAGGALLVLAFKMLGLFAKGPGAVETVRHVQHHHASVPLLMLGVGLFLATGVNFGSTWFVRKEIDRYVIKGAAWLLETISHACAATVGALLAIALIERHVIEPITGDASSVVNAFIAWAIVAVTGWAGYCCVELEERDVFIDRLQDKVMGGAALLISSCIIWVSLLL